MKKINALKLLIIFATILAGVGLGSRLGRQSADRGPSSKPLSQPLSKPLSQPLWQGKHQRLLEVFIEPQGELPPHDNQDLILKARIHGVAPIPGEVHYQWILPAEASLVAGELEDSVISLPDPTKFLEVQITIQGVSAEGLDPKLIVLQASTEIDGVRIGTSGVYSNRPEAVQMATTQKISEKSAQKSAVELPRHIQQ